MQIIRTLIVDDDAYLRRLVKELLTSEQDMEVIGEAEDGQAAIRKARELTPDMVLMDIRMPGMNGIDATSRIKAEMPEIRIIILTIFDLEEYREAAMASGADGYVLKKSMMEELLPEIRRAFVSGGK